MLNRLLNRERLFFDERGVTLVELMISVAIFGTLVIASMTFFAEQAKFTGRGQNAIKLSDEMSDFTDSVDLYLRNTTQLISCGCNSAGACAFNETIDCTTAGNCNNSVLVRFETETALDPGVSPYSGCLYDSSPEVAASITNPPLMLRGCKKRFRLSYTPPTQTGTAASQPGELVLSLENPTDNSVASVIARFSGVYFLSCGHLSYSYTNPLSGLVDTFISSDNFRIQIRAKAKMYNAPLGDTAYESWHPSETGLRFNSGVHREFLGEYTFENLSYKGVVFGMSTTILDCIPDGMASPSASQCCSNFLSVDGDCLAASQCIANGEGYAVMTECCSKFGINNKCMFTNL